MHCVCRRWRRRRSRGLSDDRDPRPGAAAAGLRLVHLALGRPGSHRRDDVDPSRCRPDSAKAGILGMARMYLNGADPRSPLAAPIYADLTGLPPLLIQVGAAETLLDEATRLAKAAGMAD